MPYALRESPCLDCGRPWSRRVPAGTPIRCTPCAVERSSENARQLHAKTGPMYDRWAWAFATAIRRLAQETAPIRRGQAA